jgi:hypothetical protein
MKSKMLIAAALIGLSSHVAYANVVTSQQADCFAIVGGEKGLRTFTVEANTVDKCLLAGSGNINGGEGSGADDGLIAAGWTLANSFLTFTGLGALTGTFTIDSSAYSTWDSIAIGFKSGNGGLDPDFAIFQLAKDTLTGEWSIDPTKAGGLSHVLLYGKDPSNNTPEPATAALIGLGLLGMAAMRRRKQQ